MTQNSAPKFPKFRTLKKVPQQFQNWGGGVGPVLKNSKRKVHFLLKSSLTLQSGCRRQCLRFGQNCRDPSCLKIALGFSQHSEFQGSIGVSACRDAINSSGQWNQLVMTTTPSPNSWTTWDYHFLRKVQPCRPNFGSAGEMCWLVTLDGEKLWYIPSWDRVGIELTASQLDPNFCHPKYWPTTPCILVNIIICFLVQSVQYKSIS